MHQNKNEVATSVFFKKVLKKVQKWQLFALFCTRNVQRKVFSLKSSRKVLQKNVQSNWIFHLELPKVRAFNSATPDWFVYNLVCYQHEYLFIKNVDFEGNIPGKNLPFLLFLTIFSQVKKIVFNCRGPLFKELRFQYFWGG